MTNAADRRDAIAREISERKRRREADTPAELAAVAAACAEFEKTKAAMRSAEALWLGALQRHRSASFSHSDDLTRLEFELKTLADPRIELFVRQVSEIDRAICRLAWSGRPGEAAVAALRELRLEAEGLRLRTGGDIDAELDALGARLSAVVAKVEQHIPAVGARRSA